VILPYIFFLYFYQYNYGNTSTRYILAAVPFLGMAWAFGIESMMKINKKIVIIFLVLFMLAFSASEAVKSAIITHQWNVLSKDFEWVQEHTKKDSLFIVPGQCLGYRLDRQSFPAKGSNYNLKPSIDPDISRIDYIFDINNIVQGPIKAETLSYYIPYFQKVYENNKTNVKIYQKK